MSVRPTSIGLDTAMLSRLDVLASALDRSRSWLISTAVERYLSEEEAYVNAVMKGIEDADAGRVVPHDDVMAQMDAIVRDA